MDNSNLDLRMSLVEKSLTELKDQMVSMRHEVKDHLSEVSSEIKDLTTKIDAIFLNNSLKIADVSARIDVLENELKNTKTELDRTQKKYQTAIATMVTLVTAACGAMATIWAAK